jgi:hypothetical protein
VTLGFSRGSEQFARRILFQKAYEPVFVPLVEDLGSGQHTLPCPYAGIHVNRDVRTRYFPAAVLTGCPHEPPLFVRAHRVAGVSARRGAAVLVHQ